MKLKTYLEKNKISVAAFAEESGISRQGVYNLLIPDYTPRLDTLRKVERATRREVTILDFA